MFSLLLHFLRPHAEGARRLNILHPFFGSPSSGPWARPLAPAAALDGRLAAAAGGGARGLTGRWRKDRAASDDMAPACDLVALPWVLRQGIRVLNYLELEDTDAHFATTLKAGGVLDVVERYPWSGEMVPHPRRDKRRGAHRGRVVRDGGGGAAAAAGGAAAPGDAGGWPRIEVEWDDPYGGACADTFALSPDGGVLTQTTRMAVGGRSVEYKTVFRRAR